MKETFKKIFTYLPKKTTVSEEYNDYFDIYNWETKHPEWEATEFRIVQPNEYYIRPSDWDVCNQGNLSSMRARIVVIPRAVKAPNAAFNITVEELYGTLPTIPDGYEFDRFGLPEYFEYVLDTLYGNLLHVRAGINPEGPRVIVRKK